MKNFVAADDYRDKIKEGEKMDKYLGLARVQKMLIIIKVTLTPIVVNALVIVPNDLKKGLQEWQIRGRIDIIQATALLRSARILRKILET